MTKVSDILKPKSSEEISRGLNELSSVDRFCAEFNFQYNKLIVKNLRTINFIINRISNKEEVNYLIIGPTKKRDIISEELPEFLTTIYVTDRKNKIREVYDILTLCKEINIWF